MPDRPTPSLFDDAPAEPSLAGVGGSAGAGLSAAGSTDGKAADALRTIGEVAAALGLRQHVLRYWEDQFPMLRPLKRSGGRRYYRPADIALLARIDGLVHREGYTLRGARLVLQGKGAQAAAERDPAMAVGEGPDAASAQVAGPTVQGLSGRLKAIRDRLAAAVD